MSFPWHVVALSSGFVALGLAQATEARPASEQAPAAYDQMTAAEVKTEAAALLTKAQASPSGMATETLKKYPGHFTMLTVRLKSGGAEQHDRASDIFVVISGEATELVGGTIADRTSSAPGEVRGSHVAGGTEHVMRQGDIVHIAPGTPHQTLVAPGQTFIYYVIKVQQ